MRKIPDSHVKIALRQSDKSPHNHKHGAIIYDKQGNMLKTVCNRHRAQDHYKKRE